MKQLTPGQTSTSQSEAKSIQARSIHERRTRGRSILSGFSMAFGRPETKRRMFDSLRPEGGLIPLDLEMVEVVAELDPGMVDWQGHHFA